MKRLILFIGAAFLTFMIGVAVNRIYTAVSSIFADNAISSIFADNAMISPVAKPEVNGDLEVAFVQLVNDGPGKIALFEVTNGASETAYYMGYGRNSHCSELVLQGRQIELPIFCSCGTGLMEQSIAHGESVILKVPIHYPRYSFEVGFDFTFGEKRLKKTVWSSKIEPSSAPAFER